MVPGFELEKLIFELTSLKNNYQGKFFQYKSLINGETGNSFKIGDVLVKNPVISAPLAGISDNTYRIMAKTFGAALTFSEMITSYGIKFRHKKSLDLAEITYFEKPCAIQVFGSDPDIISEAARIIEAEADIIDINMGCPVNKVLKSGSGGFLLQDEKKIKLIISRAISSVKKPVTVKVRTGWDKNNINVLNVAKIAEQNGASAITIHGRTVKQGFCGEVDYEVIKNVKEKIKIPVIVSGDIDSVDKALQVLNYTGCDGLMIGRASKGCAWIFQDMVNSLLPELKKNFETCKSHKYSGNKNEYEDLSYKAVEISDVSTITSGPDLEWKKDFAILYLKFLIYFKGEKKAVKEFRKYLSWIFKGTRRLSRVKSSFFKIENFNDAESVILNLNL